MKKILFSSILVTGFAVFFVGNALADSSISLSPVSISPKAGSTVNVTVTVNPNSVSNSTVKLVLNYPADLLQATGFTFAGNWMPLTQTGYDSIDNTGGTLIKTGGYPGGFSTTTTLGTVTFKAKRTGTGAISIGSGSMVLDLSSKNVLTDISSTVTISIPTLTAPTPKPSTIVGNIPAVSPVTGVTESATPSPIVAANALPANGQQYGTIATALGIHNGTWWIWLVVLLVIIYLIYRIFRKRSGPSQPTQ